MGADQKEVQLAPDTGFVVAMGVVGLFYPEFYSRLADFFIQAMQHATYSDLPGGGWA